MTQTDDGKPTEALEMLARREAELHARRQEIAALNAELEETNRGLIALHAELESARLAEARLVAIVQSSDDAMFATTPAGVVETWNHGAERLFGYGATEIVGRPVATLLSGEARDELNEALRLICSGGRARPYDTRWRRKDGSLVDVAITVSAMRDPDGDLTGFSAVVRNVTDRLRLEAELVAARAEQEVMADRDRIARDLHDMVIQRVFGAGLALQATAALVDNPQATTRLQAVIGELDVTIEELRTAIFDLHQLPEQAITLPARLRELTSNAAEGLGFVPTVGFDGPVDEIVPDNVAVHLIAVVREALSNIVRHAHAAAAEVMLSVSDAELVLHVTDDGCGIGQATRSSGLANLRDRARALGGTFEIFSEPGAGTRLEWRVPLS